MKIITKLYIFSISVVVMFVLHFGFTAYQQKGLIFETDKVVALYVDIIEKLNDLTGCQFSNSILLERSGRYALEKSCQNRTTGTSSLSEAEKTTLDMLFSEIAKQIRDDLETGIRYADDLKTADELNQLLEKIQKIDSLHENYLRVSQSYFDAIKGNNLENLILLETSFSTSADEMNASIESMRTVIQMFMAGSVEKIRQHERKSFQLFLLSSALLLILVSAFLVIIIRKINKSIQRAVDFAKSIEAGSREIPPSVPATDEIFQITHSMEFMLQAISRTEDELRRVALTDALTGVANRLKFNTALEEDAKKVKRYNQPLSLIMFDIDHFKRFNDTFGHDAGDMILIELTALLKHSIRSSDLLARWGGEEFMILAAGVEGSKAFEFAEKLRKKVEEHQFTDDHKVTCSFGVAQYFGGAIDAFLKDADIALYRSKEKGRNRVTLIENERME